MFDTYYFSYSWGAKCLQLCTKQNLITMLFFSENVCSYLDDQINYHVFKIPHQINEALGRNYLFTSLAW